MKLGLCLAKSVGERTCARSVKACIKVEPPGGIGERHCRTVLEEEVIHHSFFAPTCLHTNMSMTSKQADL